MLNSALTRKGYTIPLFPAKLTERPFTMRIALTFSFLTSFVLSHPASELLDGTISGLKRRQVINGKVIIP